MDIRLAKKEDIEIMQEIFAYGRKVQQDRGNLNQCEAGYPSKGLILSDISKKAAYICEDEKGHMLGVFSVLTSPDPTYKEIEGSWLNEEPYTTIHRIAANGKVNGVGQYMIKWVQKDRKSTRLNSSHVSIS